MDLSPVPYSTARDGTLDATTDPPDRTLEARNFHRRLWWLTGGSRLVMAFSGWRTIHFVLIVSEPPSELGAVRGHDGMSGTISLDSRTVHSSLVDLRAYEVLVSAD